MATYKEIHGTNIEALASDPSNPVNGQVWYNTTSNVLKGFKSINAWATTNSLNTARAYLGGGGTQTSALAFGGEPGSGTTADTELYNGTNWTEVNNLNSTRRNVGGCGESNTNALCMGGFPSYVAITESWNGTNWTEVNDLNDGKRNMGVTGTNTAALVAGGAPGPGASTAETELWNGTNWTEVNDLNTARNELAASGTP